MVPAARAELPSSDTLVVPPPPSVRPGELDPPRARSHDTPTLTTSGLPRDTEGDTLPTHDRDEGPSPREWVHEQLRVVPREAFEVQRVFAEGGIGRILEARDRQLQRRVAVKELHGNDPMVKERFVREVLITARLQHPSIVPIYEAGQWPTGEPFYSMRLVDGESLAEKMVATPDRQERLALLRHITSAAEAVAYAHDNRVIHRDLKPDNILVGAFGETVVIDWGLAKQLPTRDTDDEETAPGNKQRNKSMVDPRGLTAEGSVMGTPHYMAPEQALGKEVDERSDVYALGAILYELLAGVTPYESPNLAQLIGQLRTGPPPALVSRCPGLPPMLVAIVDKATAYERGARYRTAKELAADLRRFETGHLVAEHQATASDRLTGRHRLTLAGVGAVAAALLVVFALLWRSAAAERDELAEARAAADGERQVAAERADQLVVRQAGALLPARPNEAIAWLSTLSPGWTGWAEVRRLASMARAEGLSRALRGHEGRVLGVAFAPSSDRLLTVGEDRTVRSWDPRDGAAGKVFEGSDGAVTDLVFGPSGKVFATTSAENAIYVHGAEGKPKVLVGHMQPIVTLAFSPGEDRLVSLAEREGISVWTLATGKRETLVAELGAHEALAVSDDLAWVAFAAGNELFTWSWSDAPVAERGHLPAPVGAIALSSDGGLVAAGDDAGWLHHWRRGRSTAPRSVPLHDKVRALRFVPGSATLVSAGLDGTVKVLDLDTGQRRLLARDQRLVFGLTVARDGRLAAWGRDDGTVQVAEIATGALRALHGLRGAVTGVALSADGQWLAASSADGTTRIWRLTDLDGHGVVEAPGAVLWALTSNGSAAAAASKSGAVLAGLVEPKDPVRWDLPGGGSPTSPTAIALADGGGAVAAGFSDGVLRVARQGGQTRELREHKGAVTQVAFASAAVVSTGEDGRVLLWRGEDPPDEVARHAAPVTALAVGDAGRRLTSGSRDGQVLLWEGKGEAREVSKASSGVTSLALSPDGASIAVGTTDRYVRVWTLQGARRSTLSMSDPVGRIAYSPRGTYLVATARDRGRLRLWRASDGELVHTLESHGAPVTAFAFSADEQRLATADEAGAVRLWSVADGSGRDMLGHGGTVTVLAFRPDGKSVLSGGADGALRLWRDDLPDDDAGLRRWLSDSRDEALPVPAATGAASSTPSP